MAGGAWFGYPKGMPLAERNRRVMGVLLRWENPQLSDADICSMVHADREELSGWLEELPVLRDAVYRSLFLDGPRLVQALLALPRLPDLFEIATEASAQDADEVGLGGWKNWEVAAIVWRFGF